MTSFGRVVEADELQSPSDLADLVTLIDNWLNEFAEEGEHVLAIDRGTSDEICSENSVCEARENQKRL